MGAATPGSISSLPWQESRRQGLHSDGTLLWQEAAFVPARVAVLVAALAACVAVLVAALAAWQGRLGWVRPPQHFGTRACIARTQAGARVLAV